MPRHQCVIISLGSLAAGCLALTYWLRSIDLDSLNIYHAYLLYLLILYSLAVFHNDRIDQFHIHIKLTRIDYPGDAVNTRRTCKPTSNTPSTGLVTGVAGGISVDIVELAAEGFMAYRRHAAKRRGAPTQQPPGQEPVPGYPQSRTISEYEYKKSYDPGLAAYPPQTAVFELPEGRPRTPELGSGWR